MKNILITGVAGLIGSHFANHLISKGFRVIGIDDLSGGFRDSIPDGVGFYKADLRDRDIVKHIFSTEMPECVYHFAAYAAEGLSPFIRNYNYSNNILCSTNIINECVNHDVKKMIFTSSMAVYGVGSPPFTEDQLPHPEDPYGIAKYAVEMDLKLANRQFGLEYNIVRPHNVIGINQNIWDRYRNVIGIWIRKILNNEPVTIFGDGTQVRAFSDIKFYMNPLDMLMDDYNGEIFNIGADNHITIDLAADMLIDVAKEIGYTSEKIYFEKRDEVHTAYCDHKKAKDLLGFNDNTDLRLTMKDMFLWAMSQPNHEVKKMEYEIEKSMYEFWK